MFTIPAWLAPYKLIAIASGIALLTISAFATGWKIQGWRLNTQIAEIKQVQAETEAQKANMAMADLAAASALIRTKALEANKANADLSQKLDLIRKDLKNAKPLAPDCKPDDVRMRALSTAIDTANQATTR